MSISSLSTRAAVVLVLSAVASAGLSAQPLTRLGQAEQTRTNSAGYYYHHLPGEATIQLQVSGAVLFPGLYEVSVGSDLRRVLALAGGPRLDVLDRQSDRRVRLTLFRPQEGAIYVSSLDVASVYPELIPALQQDDSILVDVLTRRRFGWQDAATVIGALGTFGFLIQAAR